MLVKVNIFIVVKFTNQQRLEIIKNYYRNSESVVATLRMLTPIFGRNNRPTRQAVRAIVDKFETKFTLLDVLVPKRRHIARSEEIIAAVSAPIRNEPNHSIPRRSQELGIAQTTLWRIMRKDLGLHAFKIKLTQELKALDHLKRRNFSNWALAKLEENEEFDINDMWFQQDGATSHTARVTIDLLKGKFGERVISRNGLVEWPPRSCDLTPLDFFLWGYIKSLVCANKPATLDDLKNNIQREIANVPVEMCVRVVENCVQRIDRCKRPRGSHMTDIEFHS